MSKYRTGDFVWAKSTSTDYCSGKIVTKERPMLIIKELAKGYIALPLHSYGKEVNDVFYKKNMHNYPKHETITIDRQFLETDWSYQRSFIHLGGVQRIQDINISGLYSTAQFKSREDRYVQLNLITLKLTKLLIGDL